MHALMVLSHPRFRWLQSRRDSHHRFTRVSMTLRRRVFRLSKKDIAIGSVTYNQYGYSYPSLYLSSRPGLSRTMADGGGLKPAVATQPPRAVNVFAGVPFSAGGGGVLISLATVQRCNGPTNRRHPGRAHLKLAAIGRRRRPMSEGSRRGQVSPGGGSSRDHRSGSSGDCCGGCSRQIPGHETYKPLVSCSKLPSCYGKCLCNHNIAQRCRSGAQHPAGDCRRA